MIKGNILNYNFPQDLKNMSGREMDLLSIQIREFLVDSISSTGGHLSSNLGTVELSIALHRFFDTPRDKIVWDVGHQTYVHKILTGRAEKFSTLRKIDGLSGFPKRCESVYDTYDTGHSSNSISIATGFAVARDLTDEDYEVIAVIGDGALTGGMSYEALNNLGALKSKAIIIINDNGMSIGKNTGGLSRHLSKIRISRGYSNFKKGLGKFLRELPKIGDSAYSKVVNLRDKLKYSLVDGVMFEQLGFQYIGVIDGHNINELLEAFAIAKESKSSVILHIETKKGKGYTNAEKNPSAFHGVGTFDKSTGKPITKANENETYSQAFSSRLAQLAERDDRIIAISAAMIEGTGLEEFMKKFPRRTFDVGIAEAHAVTFAGSLGISKMKPVVAIYSTFLQRAYDQIITDIALQNSDVVLAIDRAGAVGADGETHHGLFDISYIKNIPNVLAFSPCSCEDLKCVLEYAVNYNGPVAIRYPRGYDSSIDKNNVLVMDGRDRILIDGNKDKDVVIFALGNMVERAVKTARLLLQEDIHCAVVAVRCLSPIDEETLNKFKNYKLIVTIEDGLVDGGYGESVSSHMSKAKHGNVLNIGWSREFIPHGDVDELMDRYGINPKEIAERICDRIEG